MNREIKFRAAYKDRVYNVTTNVPLREGAKGMYSSNGYIRRKVSEHPFSDKRGYVLEHRLIVEENLQEFLPKHVVIHHKNKNRKDNRLSNLEIIQDQARHAVKHDPGSRNENGRFVCDSPEFSRIKFRLYNKDTGLTQVYTLSKLISTTFRNSKFGFRGRFTGLKDKNGKEIYEGDKIRVRFHINDVEDWIYLSLSEKEKSEEMVIGEVYPIPDCYHQPEINADDIEVIGNIHENPNP